ncbi:MAG: ABC transporter ATP-binding protein [Candidatus Brocadiae bacterium]|nr:ABC transporter ATP-binding protein [Candidatus Brocadiia bacterium]
MHTIEVSHVAKSFGETHAVVDVSFDVERGEIFGLLGPNGAGKTTTLRMLATVEEPTGGDAWLDGHSITRNADEVRRLMGFMPDYFGAYPHMLVSEYLDFFARAYGLKGEGRRRRLEEIVGFIEIGPLLSKQVETLSKGMKQRISLGRALLHDPAVLLLDEPAAGLDPQARHDLQELLRLLAAEQKTIFISSHILAELEEMIDQVVIIDEGKLVFAGRPEERLADGSRKTVLNMKIMGDLKQAAKVLLENPNVRHVHPLEPDMLKVEVTGENENVAELVKSLVAHDLVPYQVMTEGRLLERIFLEATQNDKGQGNAETD